MTFLATVAQAPASDGGSLNTLFLVAMILTAFVGTGFIAAGVAVYRRIKAAGVREDRLDALIDEKTGVMARLSKQDRAIDKLEHLISPNGLKDDGIGNIVKRTELALNRLAAENDAEHRGIWRELDRKVDRP